MTDDPFAVAEQAIKEREARCDLLQAEADATKSERVKSERLKEIEKLKEEIETRTANLEHDRKVTAAGHRDWVARKPPLAPSVSTPPPAPPSSDGEYDSEVLKSIAMQAAAASRDVPPPAPPTPPESELTLSPEELARLEATAKRCVAPAPDEETPPPPLATPPPQEKPAAEEAPSPPANNTAKAKAQLTRQDNEIAATRQERPIPPRAIEIPEKVRRGKKRPHQAYGRGRQPGNGHARPPPPPPASRATPSTSVGKPEKSILSDSIMTRRGLEAVVRAGKLPRIVCDEFEVVAHVRGSDGKDPGLLVHIPGRGGTPQKVIVPRASLFGEGRGACELLAVHGLHYIAPDKSAREALINYLTRVNPDRAVTAVMHGGWHRLENSKPGFLLGDQQFGGKDMVLAGELAGMQHNFGCAGTLRAWQDRIGRYCIGNSRLGLVASMAFAAPVMWLLGERGGGINLEGDSRLGKTTALEIAGSICGGGEYGYKQSWHTTPAALELTAALHCDMLLVLDDMAEAEPREIASNLYMLGNGFGKSRTDNLRARPPWKWRGLCLSSSETTARRIVEAQGLYVRAGLDVRLVNVPVDAGQGMGVLEDLHDARDAQSLIRALQRAAGETYGWPLRRFLERLHQDVARDLAGLCRKLDEWCTAFEADCIEAASKLGYDLRQAHQQVRDVLRRFAVIAAGGRLATEYQILPWDYAEAGWATKVCFLAWLEERDSVAAGDIEDALRQVRHVLEQSGSERFETITSDDDPRSERIRERLGYRKREAVPGGSPETLIANPWQYWVLPGRWREVFAKGHDPKRVARAAMAAGLLLPGEGRNLAQSKYIPNEGKNIRVYVLVLPSSG